MALPAAFLSEDQFTCSICLEVFTNPVSTPCGHSFCQACISSYWDGVGSGKVYRCPLCKESFRKRPELHINRTLKEITEQFQRISDSGGEEDPSSQPHHHHHSALSSPLKLAEMPDSIFAEMMSRFQQLPTPEMPHSNFLHPSDPNLKRTSRINSHQAQSDEEPPPPYSSPRRYQGQLPRLL